MNTCPVDRIQFNNIEIYSSIRGKLLDKVRVCVCMCACVCVCVCVCNRALPIMSDFGEHDT